MGDNCGEKVEKKPKTASKEPEMAYGAIHIVRICIPVCISMSLVLIAVKAVPTYNESGTALPYIPFSEDVPTTIHRTTNSLLNALLFMCVVIAMTTILLLLYFYECYRIIHSWLTLTTFMLLTFFTFLSLKEALLSLNYPLDTITVAFFLWNFGIVGMVGIYLKAPQALQQCYLIYIASLMALTFVKYLPDWTAWIVLTILVIWDCLAVLSPKGPLRILIETAKQRCDTIPPSLIYVSFADFIVEDSNEAKTKEALKTKHNTTGIKLGLGDFIFYGLLIGKASKCGDWFVIWSCFLAILIGVVVTSTLLALYKRILPALPISICLGLIIYFLSIVFLSNFSRKLIINQIFL